MEKLAMVFVAVVFACFCTLGAFVALADTPTREVLVVGDGGFTKVTTVLSPINRKGFFIRNRGSVSLWCAADDGGTSVPGKSLEIESGAAFSAATRSDMFCRSPNSTQVGDAGTVVMEFQ